MKRFLILLVTMLLCIAPAYAAEDVFTVDAQSIAEDAWDESFIAKKSLSICPKKKEGSEMPTMRQGIWPMLSR